MIAPAGRLAEAGQAILTFNGAQWARAADLGSIVSVEKGRKPLKLPPPPPA